MSNLNRRSFLKQSALVTTGMLVAPTIIPAQTRGGN
ncbi:MAG: twin-arginine translocation signal domain-containing protein, partial [Tannerella sp.]|nr:twin-arginine translocation signal domain-containing protein [Tannerella sp.]